MLGGLRVLIKTPSNAMASVSTEDPAVTRFRQYLRIKTVSDSEDPKPDYREEFALKMSSPARPPRDVGCALCREECKICEYYDLIDRTVQCVIVIYT